jgi:aminopeptidase N
LGAERLILLDRASNNFEFPLVGPDPVISINRGFTAPVIIERSLDRDALLFLAAKDDDPFARYEAMQELAVGALIAEASGEVDGDAVIAGRKAVADAMGAVIVDTSLEDSMRGELLMLPSESYLFEAMASGERKADPGAIHAAREAMKSAIGTGLSGELLAAYERCSKVAFDDPKGVGARKIKTLVLGYLAASDADKAAELASAQFDAAENMTDRQGALMVLSSLESPAREERLASFYQRFAGNDLVIDKWFTLQALSLHPNVLAQVETLAKHPDFTMNNPNRVRSLYMALAGNPSAFHSEDGVGYKMIADCIIALDPINPQTAARFVPALGRWRRIEPRRAALMKAELERIAAQDNLSRDTYEQVSRSLDG